MDLSPQLLFRHQNVKMISEKQLMVFSAITDILRIFADTEIGGQYEFDFATIAAYLDSFKMATDYFDCSSKEQVYERFTADIYNGLPVWRMLKLPQWTADMVEKSFAVECQQEYKQACKTYKCLTCKYFEMRETEIGVYQKCRHTQRIKREPFTIKKRCKNYEPVQKL